MLRLLQALFAAGCVRARPSGFAGCRFVLIVPKVAAGKSQFGGGTLAIRFNFGVLKNCEQLTRFNFLSLVNEYLCDRSGDAGAEMRVLSGFENEIGRDTGGNWGDK